MTRLIITRSFVGKTSVKVEAHLVTSFTSPEKNQNRQSAARIVHLQRWLLEPDANLIAVSQPLNM
jgi:hypothetical protein